MKNTKSINGSELKEFRKNQGWSQKDLAIMLNVSPSLISHYECGLLHTPRKFSVEELEELCKTIATELVKRKSKGKRVEVKKVEIVNSSDKTLDDVIKLLINKMYESLSFSDNYDQFNKLCESYKFLKLK